MEPRTSLVSDAANNSHSPLKCRDLIVRGLPPCFDQFHNWCYSSWSVHFHFDIAWIITTFQIIFSRITKCLLFYRCSLHSTRLFVFVHLKNNNSSNCSGPLKSLWASNKERTRCEHKSRENRPELGPSRACLPTCRTALGPPPLPLAPASLPRIYRLPVDRDWNISLFAIHSGFLCSMRMCRNDRRFTV